MLKHWAFRCNGALTLTFTINQQQSCGSYPSPSPPMHSGCPFHGTCPNRGQSLVHSLPKYLQSSYQGPGSAREPVARLRPTAYSGECGCDSSCLVRASSGMSCPRGPRPLSHLPYLQIFKCFPVFPPFPVDT